MKKILSIKTPIVKSYKWHAVPLTILSAHVESEPWIYNNYLQILVQGFPTNEHWLDFFSLYDLHYTPNFPWLNVENIDINTICKYTDFINFLVDCINNNHYIDLLYDLYYLDHGFTYMKSHRLSNMLVYGYDLDEKVFYVMDYTYNSRNIYESIKINMDKLIYSVIESKSRGIKAIYEFNKNYTFDLDIGLAITLLSDYILAKNSMAYINSTYKVKQDNVAYGIDTYEYLYNFLEMVYTNKIEFNILPLCSFLEHKACIYYFSVYIDKNYIRLKIPNYKRLYDIAIIIKNLGIKFKITKNKSLLLTIKNELKNLFFIETQILKNLLNILEQL